MFVNVLSSTIQNLLHVQMRDQSLQQGVECRLGVWRRPANVQWSDALRGYLNTLQGTVIKVLGDGVAKGAPRPEVVKRATL